MQSQRCLEGSCSKKEKQWNHRQEPNFLTENLKNSPNHNHCHLQPRGHQLCSRAVRWMGPEVLLHKDCWWAPKKELRRGSGTITGTAGLRMVKQLCVGCDSEDWVEVGELSPVRSALTSLCSVVDTSLPLPDTHLSHLPRQPSCQSVRYNELAFVFTP